MINLDLVAEVCATDNVTVMSFLADATGVDDAEYEVLGMRVAVVGALGAAVVAAARCCRTKSAQLGCAASQAIGAPVGRTWDVDSGVVDFGSMVEGSGRCASINVGIEDSWACKVSNRKGRCSNSPILMGRR